LGAQKGWDDAGAASRWQNRLRWWYAADLDDKEMRMSHVRLLICRVDEGDNQVTERARVTLPPVLADAGAAPLDTLEAQVATVGQCLLGRLCELPWDALDAQAVARYRAGQAPGSVVADGSDTLFVASRFGTLQLRRQVCAHHDGRPHIMPGNDLLPIVLAG